MRMRVVVMAVAGIASLLGCPVAHGENWGHNPEEFAAEVILRLGGQPTACPAQQPSLLGRGDIVHALTVKANHFTKAARQKIEAAGGKAIEPGGEPAEAPVEAPAE